MRTRIKTLPCTWISLWARRKICPFMLFSLKTRGAQPLFVAAGTSTSWLPALYCLSPSIHGAACTLKRLTRTARCTWHYRWRQQLTEFVEGRGPFEGSTGGVEGEVELDTDDVPCTRASWRTPLSYLADETTVGADKASFCDK